MTATKNATAGYYHPAPDSLVTVSKAGEVFAFSSKSGKLIAPLGKIPGAPAISGTGMKVPGFIAKKVDPLMDAAFGKTDGGLSLFSSALNYLYGGGGVVIGIGGGKILPGAKLTLANLDQAVIEMAAACAMFD